MRILFASGFLYFPQATGGSQAAMHDLAIEFKSRGIEVGVLAPFAPTGYVGFRTRALMKLLGKQTVRDDRYGYPVFRRWDASRNLEDLVAEFKPDVAIAQPMSQVKVARELLRLSIPTLVYLHDVVFDELEGDPRELRNVGFISNSDFTARRFRELFGLDSTIVPPLFLPERYIGPRRPTNVTFINPHPRKGVDIALEIAKRCPEIPFCFQESWPLSDELKKRVDDVAKVTGNITLKPATRDMKSVYSRTKILLTPSTCEEAWGRVVSEAQFTGIPVVASRIGGLPEAVGPGGILISPNAPVEEWVSVLRRLWNDEDFYAEKSSAALTYSKRPILDRDNQMKTLIALAQDAAARSTSAAPMQHASA